MMTCEEFFAEFGDYLENRVSPELRMELEQHRLHCRECDVLFDSTFKAIKIVSESNSFDLPENVSGRDYRARYGKVEVRSKSNSPLHPLFRTPHAFDSESTSRIRCSRTRVQARNDQPEREERNRWP